MLQKVDKLQKIDSPDINLAEGYVINIDKPLGWTSTDVVRKVRVLARKCGYRKIKVGHAGTLDPLATGVLLVCIGKATKSVDALQSERKSYTAELTFGATTPSFDMEHPVDNAYPFEHIERAALEAAFGQLTGERLQTPPVYSAKKIDGQRAYELAREGLEVPVRQALVNIYDIRIEEFDLPRVRVTVDCSKGTYIRSIAMEVGPLVGSGAYLSALRRTASGGFTAADALSIEEVEKIFSDLKQNG